MAIVCYGCLGTEGQPLCYSHLGMEGLMHFMVAKRPFRSQFSEQKGNRRGTVICMHQQKKRLLQTHRHCVRTQEIHLEYAVRKAHPPRAPAQWLHPSPLGAIQPASCPRSAPRSAISHVNLPKNTKISD